MNISLQSLSFAASLVIGTTFSAHAAIIQPNTAVASTQFTSGFNGLAVNTINGSGLPTGFDILDLHAAYASGNHWTTTGGPPTNESITWGFSTPQILDTIYLWNHQSTNPPASNPGYEVVLFDLTLFDASNSVLQFFDNLPLAPDSPASQTFSFGGSVAGISSVRFDVEAVQSSTSFTGLAEVAFNQVPEPSAALLVGIGVIGLCVRLRHREYPPCK